MQYIDFDDTSPIMIVLRLGQFGQSVLRSSFLKNICRTYNLAADYRLFVLLKTIIFSLHGTKQREPVVAEIPVVGCFVIAERQRVNNSVASPRCALRLSLGIAV